MKKAFLLALSLLSLSSLWAQESKPLRIGVEGGQSISNYINSDRISLLGFYVGVRGEYELNHCYLSAGLRYIRKGADALKGDSDSEDFYRADYLELPLAAGMKARLGKRADFFLETGPYLALGIGGKVKGSSISYGPDHIKYWDNGFFTKANGNPSRFDWGWGVKTGVSLWKSLQLSIGYELGFRQTLKEPYSDDFLEGHNSCFILGVGYMFSISK